MTEIHHSKDDFLKLDLKHVESVLELFLGLLVALAGIDGLLRDYVWLLFAQDTRFLRRKHSRWWRLPSRGKRTSVTGY